MTTSANTSPPRSHLDGQFYEKEIVLAYHHAQLYPAKIIKTKTTDDGPRYYIHYNGWNDRWDEWVDSSRILKQTPENLQLQEELKAGTGGGRSKSAANRKRKQMEEAQDAAGPTFHLEMPPVLRARLVNDHDSVLKDNYLLSLPPPQGQRVADILDAFVADPFCSHPLKADLAFGLLQYFDSALGLFLLYKFERQQYADLLKLFSSKPASQIYGVDHLLRLFVKLPNLVSRAGLAESTAADLLSVCNDILRWLAKNLSSYTSSYLPPDSSYLKRLYR